MDKNFIFFTILTSSHFLLSYVSNNILGVDALLYNSIAEQLSSEQVIKVLEFKEKWRFVSYIILPILLLLKISILAGILDVGCFFLSKEIKYKKIFNIVVRAEFIFLLVIVFKTAWFYFFQADYNLDDLQYFYPLSALNIISYDSVQPWFVYPLQVLNAFEIIYWIVLAILLEKAMNIKKSNLGIKIVASSYGPALLIWVVAVMFFTLNIG